MRLSSAPDTLHIECTKCSRKGRYAKARLLSRYGPDMNVGRVLEYIAGDCRLRDASRLGDPAYCGAYIVELRQEKPAVSSAMEILKRAGDGKGKR